MENQSAVAVVTPFESMEDFWNYLARTTDLDAEILDDYRLQHRKLWRPLGKILLELGVLDWDQVTLLLNMQCDEPHVRLGELAVREKMCTQGELDEAIDYHAMRHPHPFELLARDERLDVPQVFKALLSYTRHLEGRVRNADRGFK